MRVLIVAPALTPWAGGPSFSVAALAAKLKNFCEISVLCQSSKIDYSFTKREGVGKLYDFHIQEVLKALHTSDHWLNVLIRNQDIAHFNGFWRWEEQILALLCSRLGVPYILQPRGMLLVGHRRIWLKKLFNLLTGRRMVGEAKRIIALSQFEVLQFRPYRIPPSKIRVIPNGISEVLDIPESSRLSGPKDIPPHYFLYLGRLEHRKNLDFLLRAFHQYRCKGGTADLLLVGPSERRYDRFLKRWVGALDVNSCVHFMKPVYDERRLGYMHHSLATIYPSREEAFGRVVFEALSSGTFSIVPDESGGAEYIRPFLPECLFQLENTDSLVKSMQTAEKAQASGQKEGLTKARQWLKKELSWDKIASQFYTLYEEVLESAQPAPGKLRAQSKS